MKYRLCETDEKEIGMLYYLSTADGTGGRIKVLPEDFEVNEVSEGPEEDPNGKYTIARVKSSNWETNRMVRLMSRSLGVSREKIGFAGTKDKRAVTSQLMSFQCSPEELGKINLKDIEITDVYRARRPIKIGELAGNRFSIKVKETEMPPEKIPETLESVLGDIRETGGFPNYFGVQRFGVVRPVTHRVGEKLVRGDTEGAVRDYLSYPSVFENEEVAEARKELAQRDDWGELLKIMPQSMGFEKSMVGHLADNPGDWNGAIESLPGNLQMMLVHAYQSYIFNLMLSERMERGLPLNAPVEGDSVLPICADGTPDHEHPSEVTSKNIDLVANQVKSGRAAVAITVFGRDSVPRGGEMGEIEARVIEREGIKTSDFTVVGLPRCSSKGSMREIVCPVKDLKYSADPDGYEISFYLTKGNYATCLMREFMKSEMLSY
ncbi:MAG: tRNA pseudouridine(13) synthase TruD [Candidatus Methanomethylophilaceae archaeon]|jgi:tRNA pseudouridine13 synthase